MQRPLIMSMLLLAIGCTGPRSTDDWLQQLQDPEVVKRRQAIRELAVRMEDDERILPALALALQDKNGYVRHDAAVNLAKFGPAAKTVVPALVAALKDKDRSVRKAASEALRKIDPKAALKAG